MLQALLILPVMGMLNFADQNEGFYMREPTTRDHPDIEKDRGTPPKKPKK